FLRNVKSEIQGMWIDKLEMCNASYHYPITLESSMMIRDNVQYLNFTAIVNTPFGQNQFLNASLDYSKTGDNYLPLFKFTRSNLCDFLNKDLGPFWFEIQKQIAVQPKTCPLPVGRYNMRNYQLQYKKLQIPLPSGYLKVHLNVGDNKTKQVVVCVFCLVKIE
ncbi:unnamed protein product, partial [Tenebrio molitor]